MSKPIKRLAAEEAWREAFAGFSAMPAWLMPERQAAFTRFEKTGLPTPRTENWRWSDIHRYLNAPYPPLSGAEAEAAAQALAEEEARALLAQSPFAAVEGDLVVFVNGRFSPALSAIEAAEGVDILSLAEVPLPPEWAELGARGDDAVDLLNLAYATDGALIRVRPGVKAPRPVIVAALFTGEGHSAALRHFVRVEAGAALELIEVQLGGGDRVANTMCKAVVEEGAALVRLQANVTDAAAIHFGTLSARLEKAARLQDLAVLTGGRFHRQNDFVDLAGESAEATVDSAYLLRGRQHADTRLVVNHLVPHGTSRETFKCVMDESARGAFQGKIHVAPGAQKTDGQMAAHGLLLGEAAEFDAKPELEIYADDVVCAHGATAGALDEEQLFYLRARGIPLAEARAMLISAFVAETFDAVENEAARAGLQALAERWLKGEEASA